VVSKYLKNYMNGGIIALVRVALTAIIMRHEIFLKEPRVIRFLKPRAS